MSTKQHPTPEQWADITRRLDSLFDVIHLRCDGYLVSATLGRIKNRLEIMTYVNGEIKGKWWGIYDDESDMHPEARLFLRHSKRPIMKPKELKIWEKIHGKRECKKRGYYGHKLFVMPTWLSARSLVANLKRRCTVIEILTPEQYKQAIAALTDVGAQPPGRSDAPSAKPTQQARP